MEHRQCIREAEGYYEKCSLLNIRRVNTHLVIAGEEMHFGEDVSQASSSRRSSTVGVGKQSLIVTMLRAR